MTGQIALSEIAEVIGIDYHGTDKRIMDISTDSRTIKRSSLFIALTGDSFDGHDYIKQALGKGAVMAVCQAPGYCPDELCFIVDDTVTAYGKIARLNRSKFSGTLIALTGSAGKTTTKAMMHSVLSRQGRTHSSIANENNEIGVAKNLIELDEAHEYAIIEMGARKAGDIDWLCQIAQPDIGLVLNVSEAHLETFGNINDIARAKGEIFANMGAKSIAVANADDAFSHTMTAASKAQSYFFSLENNQSNCYLSNIRLYANTASFNLHISLPFMQDSQIVNMSATGRHNLYNASATALAAALAGCPMDIIVAGLESFEPVASRQNIITLDKKTSIVDDSYNANPASLMAAIDALILATDSTPILVLGDMLELGSETERLHVQAGEYAAHKGVVMLFTIGQKAALAAKSFRKLCPGMAFSFDSHTALADQLIEVLKMTSSNVRILIKGSRSMAMEQIISELQRHN